MTSGFANGGRQPDPLHVAPHRVTSRFKDRSSGHLGRPGEGMDLIDDKRLTGLEKRLRVRPGADQHDSSDSGVVIRMWAGVPRSPASFESLTSPLPLEHLQP